MTSKISFSKLLKRELNQYFWLFAVQAVLYFLVIPFRVILNMSSYTSLQYEMSAAEKLEELCSQIGFDCFGNVLLVLAAGIVCGLCLFSYVHSAVKLDFYHSLPVKREKLFALHYLTGAILFAVPYAAAQILGVLAGALYGVFSPMLVIEMLVCILQHILFFLCSYSGTILAVMLTGKTVTSICAIAVLGGYLPFCGMFAILYVQEYLTTWMDVGGWIRDEWNVIKAMVRFGSPWGYCLTWGSGAEIGTYLGMTGRWPSLIGICQLIAIIALVSGLALFCYKYRKTEAANSALAFSKLEGVTKILLAVPTALGAALIASLIFESALWEGTFIAVFAALACLIMEFIYRWDIRQVLQHKRHMLITFLISVLIFFPLRYDIIGFNTYLPEKSEIAAMSIGKDVFYKRYTKEELEKRMPKTFDAAKSKEKLVLEYLESDQIDLLYSLASQGVACSEEIRKNGYSYAADLESFDVRYRLKNGKEIYRTYEADTTVFMEKLGALLEDPEYLEKYYPIIGLEAEEVYDICAECYDDDFPELVHSAVGAVYVYDDGEQVLEENLYVSDSGEETVEEATMESGEESEETAAETEAETEEESEKTAGTETEKVSSEASAKKEIAAVESEKAAEEAEEESEKTAVESETETETEGTWTDAYTTYTSYGVEIDIPQKYRKRFLEAYQKDLMEMSFEDIWYAPLGLRLQKQEERQTYRYHYYPLNGKFENTAALLLEIQQG